jgi:uncharacterized membrane protein/nitrite reductase/ring-hydroxylating ferredoxin subunit
MRSRAHIKSHPLHPILVAFPIAFLTGALVFDILALLLTNPVFHTTAFCLLIAGIGMALIAAIPGLVDFLYTVPPKSSAKKRASKHAIFNLCMVTVFCFALYYRSSDESPSPVVFIAFESAGFVLMAIAGWMGGTLVHRNQIGVDPRYAFAGKWKEEYLTAKSGKVQLPNLLDLKRDQMTLIHVDGKRIVIARTESGYVAFDDRCTHKGGSLAGGMMICGTVQCPWHGSQFDVSTGAVNAGPAGQKILIYNVEATDGKLYLNLSI